MSENRVTEEANTVKKPSHTRGYVLQCHLNTTLTHLATDKHSHTHTHVRGINVTFISFKVTTYIN